MKDLIFKLLMGTIREKELAELKSWLADPVNRSVLEEYVRDYHDLNLATLENDVDEAYNKVACQIGFDEKPVKRLLHRWARYAAAVALLLAAGLVFQQKFFSEQEQPLIIPKNESVTLELDNGTVRALDISQSAVITDRHGNLLGEQKENQLRYRRSGPSDELVFNTLRVPNGKRFRLELSDGSVVHMNSGSSLRYPVNFPAEGREVFLSGEAYFEVREDRSRPFAVKAEELGVKVLGTRFNVAAYEEEANIEVVLVEGAVHLKADGPAQDEGVKLAPGQKGAFERADGNIRVVPVNTSLYTSWMKGQLVFRDMTFDNIVAKLERYYNVDIENGNPELGREIFNASFNNVEIEKVLSFFSEAHQINYTIENNKIIIQ